MPWLVKDEDKPENNLLFIHIPRAGGTSLTKHFNVAHKARNDAWNNSCLCYDPYHWFGMVYFFYRYWLLESSNFPWKTWENLFALCQLVAGIFVLIFASGNPAGYTLPCTAFLGWFVSTIVATAPFIGRSQSIRRAYSFILGKICFNFVGNNRWLTGTSHKGFLLHFTAANMLKHDFVTEDDLAQADSFAIVRNPYSRLVSVFSYNQWPMESFDHFVRSVCQTKLKLYKTTGSTDEWDVYCHFLPMFEFTHKDGHQIVKCIIKQEELKLLWQAGPRKLSKRHSKRLEEIPKKVRDALCGLPHANARARSKPWWDYYTKETQDLVYEAYSKDFEIFGYDTKMPNRDDLEPPRQKDSARLKPFSSNLDFTMYKPGFKTTQNPQSGSIEEEDETGIQVLSVTVDKSQNISTTKNTEISLDIV